MRLDELLKTELGKKQYRELAKRYHSDLGGHDDIMKQINAAKDSADADATISKLYSKYIDKPEQPNKSEPVGKYSSDLYNAKIYTTERPTKPAPSNFNKLADEGEEIIFDNIKYHFPSHLANINLKCVQYSRDMYTVLLGFRDKYGTIQQSHISVNLRNIVDAVSNGADNDLQDKAGDDMDKIIIELEDLIGEQINELFDRFKKKEVKKLTPEEEFFQQVYRYAKQKGMSDYRAWKRATAIVAERKAKGEF